MRAPVEQAAGGFLADAAEAVQRLGSRVPYVDAAMPALTMRVDRVELGSAAGVAGLGALPIGSPLPPLFEQVIIYLTGQDFAGTIPTLIGVTNEKVPYREWRSASANACLSTKVDTSPTIEALALLQGISLKRLLVVMFGLSG